MYSRTRAVRSEERYAGNIPPVYGGSRFYQRAADYDSPEIYAEDVRAAGTEGIPVQYEAAPVSPPSAPEIPKETEAEQHPCPGEADKKAGRFLASVMDDPEELLLLGLLLLLCCENERAPDVIVILLLLLIVR